MKKKTERFGLAAAAVLFFLYYSTGSISAGNTRVISVTNVVAEAESGTLAEEELSEPIAVHQDQPGGTHPEESRLDGRQIFERFLTLVNEQVKRIRLLVLGKS